MIGQIYKMNPDNIKFDPKIAEFNEHKDKYSYQSLKMQIEKFGQIEPILIRRGLCGDGRNRTLICKELNTDVLCVDVDPNMSDEDFIIRCNSNIFGGRNASATQLAIKTYMLVEQYGISDIRAKRLTGLKDKRLVGYVRAIMASKLNEECKIIETLLKGEAANIRGKRTKSIDVAKREVSKIEEKELLKDNSNEIDIKEVIDYDAYLNTETARAKFWEIYGKNTELTVENKLFTCELLNAKYTLKTEENTTDTGE
jgi:ParB-like chromosome segregation protein Spo0J